MHRPRVLALVAVVALWAVGAGAAEPSSRAPAARRTPGGTVHEPVVEDEPGLDREDDDADPRDDELDEGRALPSEPAFRPPLQRRVPPGEDEEPTPPADVPPVRSGPAEPASAAQPLPPS
ncbi:MAG TPA: hypothetical protein VEM57_10750 [Candidatus Binatus sp.]|nr:hypothetical protein [Candidatus Binatus sp.]